MVPQTGGMDAGQPCFSGQCVLRETTVKNRQMNKKAGWLACGLALVGAVWSGLALAEPVIVGQSQSRLVIYRPAGTALAGVSAVQVQGFHHTALFDGTFTDMCFFPGATRVLARQWPPAAAELAAEAEEWVTLKGGRSQFLRVGVHNKKLQLTLVDDAQAQRDLDGLRAQTHTLSRVAMPCGPDPAMLVMQSVVRETLAADVAWSADGASLTEQGVMALGALVTRVRRDFEHVDRVRVVSHVDDEAQLPVARQRAETVRQLFRARAGNDWPVEVDVLSLSASPLASCGGVSAAQMAQKAYPLGPRAWWCWSWWG